DDDRVLRIIVRDIAERGRTIDTAIEHYCDTVKPMHLQFIEPSKRYADIIVPQGGHNRVAIDVLATTVQEALERKQRPRKK
ncbi:MAG: uridine kinase, partial [Treponema sp.]|nr:uridine kinase [Treponema sp.]